MGDADGAKGAAQLARRIEDEIVTEGWPVGKRLGSQAELMRRYGVSRAVLREAIRLLEHHQVARTREGRGGGLIVTAPESTAITRVLELYLQYRGVTLVDLLDTKRALELAALPIAVDRLDAAGAERLRRAVAAERAGGLFDITDDNVHITLAELTGNPALVVFVKALTRLSALLVEPVRAEHGAGHAYRTHGQIAEAIISGDVDRARRLLIEHLDDIGAQGAKIDELRRTDVAAS